MLSRGSKFLKGLFISANLCVIACFLAVCLVPYINTATFWYVAFFGLLFPLLLFALLAFLFLWAAVRSKWFWVCLTALLLGSQQILALIGFNFPTNFNETKEPNTLRVLQWNVSSWDQNEWNIDKKSNRKVMEKTNRQLMLDLVKEQNADVLCFEEFFQPLQRNYYDENISKITEMGYPYHYFVSSVAYKDLFESGVAIFSKYPIVDSSKFDFGEDAHAEHLITTDIKVGDKTFRIITIHLQSVRFQAEDYESINDLKRRREAGLKDSRTIVSKLKRGYTFRYSQAQIVRQHIDASSYPVILCGDFNDVPNSNTYFTVKGDLKDAFLKKGFFIGRTFRLLSPTLRIDYIFCDKLFSVDQMKILHVPWSDHYPVKADLKY